MAPGATPTTRLKARANAAWDRYPKRSVSCATVAPSSLSALTASCIRWRVTYCIAGSRTMWVKRAANAERDMPTSPASRGTRPRARGVGVDQRQRASDLGIAQGSEPSRPGVRIGAAAAAGLSALIASSELAYDALRYLGAAYLLFLGVRTLRSEPDRQTPLAGQSSLRRAFAEGLLVNVLNPKVALFFLAFLPQFTDPARGSIAGQTLVLAACSSRSREDGRHRHRR
jgi:hypothetical protein